MKRRGRNAAAPWSRRRGLAPILVVIPVTAAIAGLPLLAATHARAAGTPGTPGTPQPPVTLYTEGFENNIPGTPLPLTSYTGVTGMTYTADPAWLASCNGDIINYNMTALPANCNAGPQGMVQLRTLAYGLGVLRGLSNPATNNALSAYTDKGNNTYVNPGARWRPETRSSAPRTTASPRPTSTRAA